MGNFIKLGAAGLALLLLASFALANIFIVDEGDRVLIVRLGKMDRVLEPGLHLKTPFVEYRVTFSVRVQRVQYANIDSYTNDNQVVTSDLLLAYHIDPAAIGREQVRLWSRLLGRALRWREVHALGETRFFDAQFTDLCDDPIAVVRALYERFDWPVSAAFELRMKAFLEDNAREKHGVHRYQLSDFALDPAETAAAFASYRERFVRGASA